MSFEQIAWLPLCAGVTAVGLVMSFMAFRRRGAASGMRVAAWALLPVAAYLTGALQALWTVGATLVGFVTGLVLNPLVWAGIAVTGLSVVLFLVSGVLRGRTLSRGRPKGEEPAAKTQPVAGRGDTPAVGRSKPAQAPGTARKPASDDDFSDVEDILKRHGIS
ncbi:hypothetical protein [Nonomuraea pusilla]|uniref:Cellulose synthase n=1 Tax=Nonomuraea pusilla TaxID=46177 RepID=A0A1H7UJL7_9ACTN|nr:hypothetical protein [Nonomuraea pusilla]SEL96497.1 hypothetical protein SAMN05660976_03820 [Nonomuraea pusilla]